LELGKYPMATLAGLLAAIVTLIVIVLGVGIPLDALGPNVPAGLEWLPKFIGSFIGFGALGGAVAAFYVTRAWVKDRTLGRASSNKSDTVNNDRFADPMEEPFDREKWNALLKYDQDIALIAEKLWPLGDKWIDEFARAYLVLNDKQYLPNITKKIIDDARKENELRQQQEEKLAAARQPSNEQERSGTVPNEEKSTSAAQRKHTPRGLSILLICLVLGVAGLTWVGFFVSAELPRRQQLHQTLLSAQAEIQKKLPMKVDDYTTLVDVLVGDTDGTYSYRIAMRKSDIDMSALEREVRSGICGSDMKARIKDGVSYRYEYLDATAALVGRFEIAACP
jgi:hypothetical protein